MISAVLSAKPSLPPPPEEAFGPEDEDKGNPERGDDLCQCRAEENRNQAIPDTDQQGRHHCPRQAAKPADDHHNKG